MTTDELQLVLRTLNRSRPFRPFFIEFDSGDRLLVSHPEVVTRQGDFFICRTPDRGQRIFIAPSVCQFIVPPSSPPPTRSDAG